MAEPFCVSEQPTNVAETNPLHGFLPVPCKVSMLSVGDPSELHWLKRGPLLLSAVGNRRSLAFGDHISPHVTAALRRDASATLFLSAARRFRLLVQRSVSRFS